MKKTTNWLTVLGMLGATALVAGCALFPQKNYRRASIVDYLYPDKATPVEKASLPVLSLPMDVGIVFVPETGRSSWSDAALTEKQKISLMEDVGNQFKKHPFIRSVNPIPSQYLRPGGSFENLDQLGTMFGIDTIALLSYDQVQMTDEHQLLSLTYWTLIGAYVVPAQRNTTHTMVDAAVYHIPSRKMLFRAPGVSRLTRHSTPVDVPVALREDGQAGFKAAATNLVTNLQEQLDLFKDKVKKTPEEYKVEAKPGFDLTAVGKLDGLTLLLVIIMGGAMLCPRRSTR